MDLMTMANFIKQTLIPMAIKGNAKLSGTEVTGVVITGLSVVFLGLIILILFVWVFGKIFTRKTDNTNIEKKNESLKSVVAPAAPVVKPADSNEDEIVAVIAAAVAAMGQADGKVYKVKSIKAAKNGPARSAWALAGIQSETMPF